MNEEKVEVLARALWEVPPYPRFFEWDDHPNEEVREHYRWRARRLLEMGLFR